MRVQTETGLSQVASPPPHGGSAACHPCGLSSAPAASSLFVPAGHPSGFPVVLYRRPSSLQAALPAAAAGCPPPARRKNDVLLPDKQRTEGTLQHHHLHYNVAIVSFKGSTSIAADIYDPVSYKYSEVVAAGRVFESGFLMATRGTLSQGRFERRFDCTDLFYSSCEITKAGIGGALVDFDGKFVGMNFYYAKEGTPFLPQTSILEVLAHFEKKRIVAEAYGGGCVNRWPVPKPFWRRPNEHHQNEDKGHRRTVDVPESSLAICRIVDWHAVSQLLAALASFSRALHQLELEGLEYGTMEDDFISLFPM